MSLHPCSINGTLCVEDTEGGVWHPQSNAFVVCRSDHGWSLHAPGSTDEQIADGSSPALVSGHEDFESEDIHVAIVRMCELMPMTGKWHT